jgi:putative serine protease PepD
MPAVADRPVDDHDDDREPTVVLPAEADDDGTPPRGRRRVAGTLALVVLAAGAGVGGAAAYDALRDDDIISSLDVGADSDTNVNAPAGEIEKVAQQVLPSVVQIRAVRGGVGGEGTGIIISSNGQILTNNHVIEAAADGGEISVAFNDSSSADAKIVGRDPLTDLAVIKAEGKDGLVPANLGSSAHLQVGQEVVAIGSPFGLESTVTSGIIGALNRPVTAMKANGQSESGFPAVQTDAAINPGNSGGPLVDLQGRVIGVVAAIRGNVSLSGEAGSIGLGFAIPVDLAKYVSEQLVRGEKAEHARIGVTVVSPPPQAEVTGIGAEVRDVTKGSAGDDAGLRSGDVVTAVNKTPVANSRSLIATIRGFRPGETVTLTYLRGGDRRTTKVKLESDGGKLSP